MRRFVRPVVCCLAICLPLPAFANLVANGSFESPLVPAGFYTNFAAGSNAIPSWSIVGVDSAIVDTGFVQNGIAFVAQNGNQWIDLAGVTSNSMSSGVTQSIATVPNQRYEVSFYVGSATDGSVFFPATIDLSIDDGPRTSYFNPATPTNMLEWKKFTASFIAAGPSTKLSFLNGSAANNYNSSLDNVSVEIVPEPGTLLAAIVSIVAALCGMRPLCLRGEILDRSLGD